MVKVVSILMGEHKSSPILCLQINGALVRRNPRGQKSLAVIQRQDCEERVAVTI